MRKKQKKIQEKPPLGRQNQEAYFFLQVPAQLIYLPAIGHFAKAIFSRHPLLQSREDDLDYALELILYESCSNVVKHAYAPDQEGCIQVKVWLHEERVIYNIIDFGKGFDLESVPPPELDNPREGGMGLFIIRNSVDEMHYEYSPNVQGYILHIEKKLT